MKKLKLLSWLAVILWMIFIYYLSAQTGEDSSILSSNLTTRILNFTRLNIGEDAFNNIIRTFAHFSLYFVLSILISNSLHIDNNKSSEILITMSIGFLYAVSDEFHQSFVPGRTAQIFDIVVDSIGLIFGIIIFQVLIIRSNKLKSKRL